MAIQKNNGSILKTTGGIANACCCVAGCPTDCSGCSSTYSVVISGVTGTNAPYVNGSYTVTRSGCSWNYNGMPSWPTSISVYCNSGIWYIQVNVFFSPDNQIVFGKTGGSCPPTSGWTGGLLQSDSELYVCYRDGYVISANMPIQKNNGSILKTTGGIANECCCGETPVDCPTNCDDCPNQTLQLVISGFTGDCTYYNGTFDLVHAALGDQCIWGPYNGWYIGCSNSGKQWWIDNFELEVVTNHSLGPNTDGCPPSSGSGTGSINDPGGPCDGQTFTWSVSV